MKFTKMHGIGNDYVFVNAFDEQVTDPAGLARVVSDRHTGVGSDGLILIYRSKRADVRMEMYNGDGSRAQMCGNGIRCVAKFALEHGLTSGRTTGTSGPNALAMTIETDSGDKEVECRLAEGIVRTVRVDMGRPSLDPASLPSTIAGDRIVDHPCTVSGREFRMTCVSMGNPHAVIFVDDLHRIALHEIGPELENAPQFPQRVNAHFVRVDARDRLTVRTWERGSGATRACGTGACAVCVAGAVSGRADRRVTTVLPGGELEIEWAHNDHVYMTGPAVHVFSGEWPAESR
jgi:diaminopimelate epimerase